MNYDELVNKVLENEQSLIDLYSNHFSVGKAVRYYDEKLKDMYDHNYSFIEEIDDELFNQILNVTKERNEEFIKICSSSKNEFLLQKGFEEEIILTMVKEDYKDFPIPGNYLIQYKNVRENEGIINDIIATEIIYYGKQYGIDFTIRRYNRYFNKIKEGENGFNLFACFYQNQIVAYCYTYYSNGVVGVDGLLVVEEFRHQYIASNLLRYIASFYNCPIYLHADEEETPKMMYEKLGFKTIDKSYDYFKDIKQDKDK